MLRVPGFPSTSSFCSAPPFVDLIFFFLLFLFFFNSVFFCFPVVVFLLAVAFPPTLLMEAGAFVSLLLFLRLPLLPLLLILWLLASSLLVAVFFRPDSCFLLGQPELSLAGRSLLPDDTTNAILFAPRFPSCSFFFPPPATVPLFFFFFFFLLSGRFTVSRCLPLLVAHRFFCSPARFFIFFLLRTGVMSFAASREICFISSSLASMRRFSSTKLSIPICW
mmetsp:Transcript_14186/g.22607  ORF Transcript_14186/g.22607 Transcript_14186/m.22607 type:complete len:221 (+) Transcript_14186:1199-1861(+)